MTPITEQQQAVVVGFIAEECKVGEGASLLIDLYARYVPYAERHFGTVLSRMGFVRALKNAGFETYFDSDGWDGARTSRLHQRRDVFDVTPLPDPAAETETVSDAIDVGVDAGADRGRGSVDPSRATSSSSLLNSPESPDFLFPRLSPISGTVDQALIRLIHEVDNYTYAERPSFDRIVRAADAAREVIWKKSHGGQS